MTSEQTDALSIVEFCRRNGISTALYFKINREGLGPSLMRVGRRTLITREAAEEWRREREAASAQPHVPEAV
jgi:hypothetical protein